MFPLNKLAQLHVRAAIAWEKERARNVQYYLAGHPDAPDDPARYDEYAEIGRWERERDYLIGFGGAETFPPEEGS